MTHRENATVSDVRQFLHYEELSEEDVELTDHQIRFHLDTYASMLVDEELADSNLSEKRLKTIEACLAGHSILTSGMDEWRQTESERESQGYQVIYSGEFGQGLKSSTLGQRAIELDTTGVLKNIAEQGTGFWSHTYP